eukprot:CAMPEP_0196656784 /NCGR_PEP_ID=MMETSP1086-20130531/19461_1 /TAXON_ID=77921 /ORGANISM="Cyanoptyche  gloeocystis , Strain SAG4.97" /LENGTH=168 /DNA_ID=CAMNT_0041989655 /DNA_START=29 /DNA_END=535 /DNA_ORIENTATION=+
MSEVADVANLSIEDKEGGEPSDSSDSPKIEINAEVQSKISAIKEWSRATVWTSEGSVIASTYPDDELPSKSQISRLLAIFADRAAAFSDGIDIFDEHFDVHRWYDSPHFLVYGRKAETLEGDGICLAKCTMKSSGKDLFALIAYSLPMVSARAVPILQKFCTDVLAEL